MKIKRFYFLLFSLLFVGCQSGNHKPQIGDLPVIDITKNYPQKEILLQDVAEIEYIPLETNDNVLLSQFSILTYISNKFICVYDLYGNVFIFSRRGEIIANFNHIGQGDKEYNEISGCGVVFDEKNEELYVFSLFRILVYSISGEYKRTLKYSKDLTITTKAYNYDDETLLVYNNYDYSKSQLPNQENNEKTYLFLSKKDGSVVYTLNFKLPVRYSSQSYMEINGHFFPLNIITHNNCQFGFNDFVLSDISSDTIYRFSKNRELTPLIVRTPSVHLSEPKTVWSTMMTTDKFIVLHKTILDFIAKEQNKDILSKFLMYEFETGKINEVSFVNTDYEKSNSWFILWGGLSPEIAKNMNANLLWPSKLKEAYKEKKIKGALEKLVLTLDDDDNPIVMIVKFK